VQIVFFLEITRKFKKGWEFGGASYSSTPTRSEAVTGFFLKSENQLKHKQFFTCFCFSSVGVKRRNAFGLLLSLPRPTFFS
jgi:hypothetical protein